jgi:L-alanine-DL-glutamate epimerase-like enolase superfamily enzyme
LATKRTAAGAGPRGCAVREQSPDCPILADANNGYTCDGFLRYFEAVVDCRLFWIEEPFREDRDDLRRLRYFRDSHSPETLIADGESRFDVPALLELAHERLLDVLLMDIAGHGFTGWQMASCAFRTRRRALAWDSPLCPAE